MSDYVIEEELGRGSQGVVYRARQSRLGRQVALKILASHLTQDSVCLERFRREMSVLCRLRHPNIVQFLDCGEHKGRPYFAMELAEGEGLRNFRDRSHPIPRDRLIEILEGLSGGLAHLHAAGIVHRDIKMENVTLEAGRRPKLIDFGLARNPADIDVTRPGIIAGTLRYMAPEMARTELSPAQDVYAFGALAWELCTGGTFRGEGDPMPAFLSPRDFPDPPLREKRPDLDPDLEELVSRCLLEDPGSRPAADEIHRQLSEMMRPGPRPALRKKEEPRVLPERRRILPPSGASWLLALGAVVLGLSVVAVDWTPPEPPRLAGHSFPQPGRALLHVSGAPPASAWYLVTTEGTSLTSGRLEPPGDIEVGGLEPGSRLELQLSSAAGPPVALGSIRTPASVPVTSFIAHETASSVIVHTSTTSPMDLELILEEPGGVTRRIPSSPTEGTAHHRILVPGLTLDTPYTIHLAVTGTWGGLRDYRFRTWTRKDETFITEQLRQLDRQIVDSPLESFTTMGELFQRPDPRYMPHLERILKQKSLGSLPVRWTVQLCRRLAVPSLANQLLDRRDELGDEVTWALVISLLARIGHPRTAALAREHLARASDPEAVRELIQSLALVGDTGLVARVVPRLPEVGPHELDPLPFLQASDPAATCAVLRPWLSKPGVRALHAARALGDRGLPEDIEMLGFLEDPARQELLDALLYSLVRNRTPGARRTLATFLARRPRDPARLWAAAIAGVGGAADEVAELASGEADPVLERAAITLAGLLGIERTIPGLRALLDSPGDAALHPVAGWSLGRMKDAASFERIARLVADTRPGAPELAWALVEVGGSRALDPLKSGIAAALAHDDVGAGTWMMLLSLARIGGPDDVAAPLEILSRGQAPDGRRLIDLARRLAARDERIGELHFIFPHHVIYVSSTARPIDAWIGMTVEGRSPGGPRWTPTLLEADYTRTLEGKVTGTFHMRPGPLVVAPHGARADWSLREQGERMTGFLVLSESRK